MGLLGKLFGGDPAKDLEKARAQLDRDPARALTLARRLEGGDLDAEARQVIVEARAKLIDNALAMAEEAEESEYFEDAAEWLERALEQVQDGERRQQLEARRESLLERAAAAEEEPWDEVDAGDGDDDDEAASPFEADAHLDALFEMMSEEVSERYKGQDAAFRSALGELLEGRVEQALESFEALAEERPEDPAVRLERGRCRLLTDDVAGARDDFEAAWEGIGDGSLFDGRAESVPGLWADAQLTLGEAEPVIERLEDLADPAHRRSDLAVPFAAALVATERFEEAEDYLRRARRVMPEVKDLSHLHASLLLRREDHETAIMVLEGVVGPACAGGTCRPAAMHVPSLRALIALHEKHGKPARARELSVYLAQVGDGAVADTGSLQPDRSATVI